MNSLRNLMLSVAALINRRAAAVAAPPAAPTPPQRASADRTARRILVRAHGRRQALKLMKAARRRAAA